MMSAARTRCPLRPSRPCRSPRASSRPFLMSAARTRRPWQPSRPFLRPTGQIFASATYFTITTKIKQFIDIKIHWQSWSNGYESGLSPRRSGFDSPPELFQFLFIIEDKLVTQKLEKHKAPPGGKFASPPPFGDRDVSILLKCRRMHSPYIIVVPKFSIFFLLSGPDFQFDC